MFFKFLIICFFSIAIAKPSIETEKTKVDTIPIEFTGETIDLYINENNPYKYSKFLASGGMVLGAKQNVNMSLGFSYTAHYFHKDKFTLYGKFENNPFASAKQELESKTKHIDLAGGYVFYDELMGANESMEIHKSYEFRRQTSYTTNVGYRDRGQMVFAFGTIFTSTLFSHEIANPYLEWIPIEDPNNSFSSGYYDNQSGVYMTGNHYYIGLQYNSFKYLDFSTSKGEGSSKIGFQSMAIHLIVSPWFTYEAHQYNNSFNDEKNGDWKLKKEPETFPIGIRIVSQRFLNFKKNKNWGQAILWSAGVYPGIKGSSYGETFVHGLSINAEYHLFFGI